MMRLTALQRRGSCEVRHISVEAGGFQTYSRGLNWRAESYPDIFTLILTRRGFGAGYPDTWPALVRLPGTYA